MTEITERAAVACPSCSPDLETVHEVLTTGGGRATVRCTECGHTHKRQLATPTAGRQHLVDRLQVRRTRGAGDGGPLRNFRHTSVLTASA